MPEIRQPRFDESILVKTYEIVQENHSLLDESNCNGVRDVLNSVFGVYNSEGKAHYSIRFSILGLGQNHLKTAAAYVIFSETNEQFSPKWPDYFVYST